jgi:hypothetical protein
MASGDFEIWGISWGGVNGRCLVRRSAKGQNIYYASGQGPIADPGTLLRIGWSGQGSDNKFKGDLAALVVEDADCDARTLGSRVDALFQTWMTPAAGQTPPATPAGRGL